MEIEKGFDFPEPEDCGRKLSEVGVALRKMGIGDSILAPYLEGKTRYSQANLIRSTMVFCSKKTGYWFCKRYEDDGVRIWRTK